MAAKSLWVEKYRPKTLADYVFQNEQHRAVIERIVKEQDLPHMLLTGQAGSGKTTVARILINELGIEETDLMEENASNKTGIDFIRDTILPFSESYPIGKFKVIFLEEFDRLSPNGQDMLRHVMEASSGTCRFICTGNHEHRVMPAILSRFSGGHLRFKASPRDDILMRTAQILLDEEVEFDPEILDRYVTQGYPDLRKIIGNLQQGSIDKQLRSPTSEIDGGDIKLKLLDLVAAGDLKQLRKLVSEQCTSDQLTEIYEFLYQNIQRHPRFKAEAEYEQALMTLLDGLYKHSLVAIPHLNFEVTCIKLSHIGV